MTPLQKQPTYGERPKVAAPHQADLTLVLPWWSNPLWALLLLTGSMMAVSIAAPDAIYATWEVRKFLTGDYAVALVVMFLALLVGTFFTSGVAARRRSVEIHLNQDKLRLLQKAYQILFWLTMIGYGAWILSAIAQGVGINNLVDVLQRAQGAIGELKNNARPIGGVTTLTQFAPIAIGINVLLWKSGFRHLPSLILLFAAAILRVLFYAERLALIELIVPFALVGAIILSANLKWRRRLSIAPLIGIPLVWVVFAISEYLRSWIYYSRLTDLPFAEWVTARLLGYYTTSFNNSALLAQQYNSDSTLPWFSIQWFWNLPLIESVVHHPEISGVEADRWWTSVLISNANYNFTNTGSFLTTYAEFGLAGSIAIWLVTGLIIGALYNSLSRGNIPALLLYSGLFVGLLELPRMIYWTLGRATPLIIAAVILMYQWRKVERANPRLPEK